MPKKAAEPAAIPQAGVPAPGSAVAKELGIALAVIYNYVKNGSVKNHKADGYPVGKGIEVDIAEVRKARGNKKTRAPKAGSKPRAVKIKDPDSGETVTVSTKARKLQPGSMVSYERGRGAATDAHAAAARPRYSVSSVLAATGKLTFIDEGDKHRHYDGTQIDNTVFGTERLSMMLAKGVARIEHPVPVLGMVILALIVEEKIELAASLEQWMIANDLDVHIPEIMDLEEDDYTPVAGQMIEADEEGEE